jgi:hypothetical protein
VRRPHAEVDFARTGRNCTKCLHPGEATRPTA